MYNCTILFELLRVKPEGSNRWIDLNEVKRNYRKILKVIHPDKNSSEEARIATQHIVQAYNILTNDTECWKYRSMGREGLDESIEWDEMEYSIMFIEIEMTRASFNINREKPEESILRDRNPKEKHDKPTKTDEPLPDTPMNTPTPDTPTSGYESHHEMDTDETESCHTIDLTIEEEAEDTDVNQNSQTTQNNEPNQDNEQNQTDESNQNEQNNKSNEDNEIHQDGQKSSRRSSFREEILEIKTHRFRGDKLKYLVEWRGYNTIGAIWEEETIVERHELAITEYLKKLRIQKPRSFSPLIKKRERLGKLLKN